jgi:uncharacterized protein (TIGR03083 family)
MAVVPHVGSIIRTATVRRLSGSGETIDPIRLGSAPAPARWETSRTYDNIVVMSGSNALSLIPAGRILFADTVEALDARQLASPTLCDGWDVRTLTAHMLLPFEVTFARFALTSLRHRGNTARTVDAVTRRIARRPVADLVAELRAHAQTQVAPRRVGPEAQLVETAVHLRDVARPLGLDADVPLEHWEAVLDYLISPTVAPGVMPRGRLDGLALKATDLDWRHGRGDELTGPAEAIAMALTGRSAALEDLDGSGRAVLAQRLP